MSSVEGRDSAGVLAGEDGQARTLYDAGYVDSSTKHWGGTRWEGLVREGVVVSEG